MAFRSRSRWRILCVSLPSYCIGSASQIDQVRRDRATNSKEDAIQYVRGLLVVRRRSHTPRLGWSLVSGPWPLAQHRCVPSCACPAPRTVLVGWTSVRKHTIDLYWRYVGVTPSSRTLKILQRRRMYCTMESTHKLILPPPYAHLIIHGG
ncbi:hypothetical protein F4808DRAFT_439503 [Astrocystis sublimbata]|nr:hypothetical protein F4808DRAFT_439503 [Astrocystis sublimbata]